MTIITSKTINSIYYSNNQFILEINQKPFKTHITMRMISPVVNTDQLPHAYNYLKRFLPSILLSKCFNDEDVPFYEEVHNTEIGHLFEHVLLQYLCQEKIANGATNAIFNGLTCWDFPRDGKGVFHIMVDAGDNDSTIFIEALKKTIRLISFLIQAQNLNTIPEVTPTISNQDFAVINQVENYIEKK